MLFEERRRNFNKLSEQERRESTRAIAVSSRDDFRHYVHKVLDDIEEAESVGNMRSVTKLTRILAHKDRRTSCNPSKGADGRPITMMWHSESIPPELVRGHSSCCIRRAPVTTWRTIGILEMGYVLQWRVAADDHLVEGCLSCASLARLCRPRRLRVTASYGPRRTNAPCAFSGRVVW